MEELGGGGVTAHNQKEEGKYEKELIRVSKTRPSKRKGRSRMDPFKTLFILSRGPFQKRSFLIQTLLSQFIRVIRKFVLKIFLKP